MVLAYWAGGPGLSWALRGLRGDLPDGLNRLVKGFSPMGIGKIGKAFYFTNSLIYSNLNDA
jgi:hypothetical protein